MSSMCRQDSSCTASALPAGEAPATCRSGLLSAGPARAAAQLVGTGCSMLHAARRQGRPLPLQTCCLQQRRHGSDAPATNLWSPPAAAVDSSFKRSDLSRYTLEPTRCHCRLQIRKTATSRCSLGPTCCRRRAPVGPAHSAGCRTPASAVGPTCIRQKPSEPLVWPGARCSARQPLSEARPRPRHIFAAGSTLWRVLQVALQGHICRARPKRQPRCAAGRRRLPGPAALQTLLLLHTCRASCLQAFLLLHTCRASCLQALPLGQRCCAGPHRCLCGQRLQEGCQGRVPVHLRVRIPIAVLRLGGCSSVLQAATNPQAPRCSLQADFEAVGQHAPQCNTGSAHQADPALHPACRKSGRNKATNNSWQQRMGGTGGSALQAPALQLASRRQCWPVCTRTRQLTTCGPGSEIMCCSLQDEVGIMRSLQADIYS